MNTLAVTPDVEFHITQDNPIHVVACELIAVVKFDGIRLGPITGEVFGQIGLKVGQVPRAKSSMCFCGSDFDAITKISSKNRATRPEALRHRVRRSRMVWVLPLRVTVRLT